MEGFGDEASYITSEISHFMENHGEVEHVVAKQFARFDGIAFPDGFDGC